MIDPREIRRRVLETLGRAELRHIQPLIGSSTLREALRLIIEESQARARLFIPDYWAVFYHDGHGPISPRSSAKLVFFDDPRNDPRLNNGRQPERASQVRRLTRAQYEEGLRRNRERRAAGRRPYMYVVDRVGPARPRPFFDQASQSAAERLGPLALREFRETFLRQMESDPATRSETGSAEFFL